MTPAQARAARSLIDWNQAKLAASADLGLSTIVDFERGRRQVSSEAIAAMQLAQKPIYAIRNGNKQAMAWVNDMGGGNPNLHPVIVKNGGTSGFGTVIAINPSKDAAIFIGMNQVGADPAEKAVEILRHLP